MVEWQDVQRRTDAGEDRNTEFKRGLGDLTEERAVVDAPPAHIDPEAFRFYLRRLGFDTMAHFMAGMGFMERRGRGWLIMRREMQGFNGTEPDLVDDERDRFVRVTFRIDSRESERLVS